MNNLLRIVVFVLAIFCSNYAICDTGQKVAAKNRTASNVIDSKKPALLVEQIRDLKQRLFIEKKVSEWSTTIKPGSGSVGLTPGECDALGGDVDYEWACFPTHLWCVMKTPGKERVYCIDELDPKP